MPSFFRKKTTKIASKYLIYFLMFKISFTKATKHSKHAAKYKAACNVVYGPPLLAKSRQL
jgi:hypothetical protein